MTITTLKASPHLLKSTIDLIEASFLYEKPNSFTVDFAPLMNADNFENSFIMIDENENVLAHIGVCIRTILGVPVAMLGGIAVAEAHRGAGYFKELILDVMAEKKSDVALIMLWSDQEKLYNKYGFHLCGTQIEIQVQAGAKNFTHYRLKDLSNEQLEQIQKIYKESFSSLYTTIERTASDWGELKKIHSTDLYIKESNGIISEYFFMNKGQDLGGIIFEYGSSIRKIIDLLQEISCYGTIWSGENFLEKGEAQYQFFVSPGGTKLFGQFIELYTNKKILIREINFIKQEMYFYFNDELLSLTIEEFLRGVLGPGPFEELGELKPIFISGLDSI